MAPHISFLVLCSLSLLLLSTTTHTTSISPATTTASPPTPTPTPTPITSTSTLDPKQLIALQSLNIPTAKDPCATPSLHNATACDASTPFRHLTSLTLSNCSDDTSLSTTALKSLSTSLTSLHFLNCPHLSPPTHFPYLLSSNLRSFSSVNSLKKLTGVFLSRLRNLTDLTISGVPIHASGPTIILSNLNYLTSVTISHSNLSGPLPKHWHSLNLTHIDFSGNNLNGKIPTSLTILENLQSLNLSSNQFTGEIPNSFGELLSLKNLSLSSNTFSGALPESMAAMLELEHLDLGSNHFNSTIPKFLTELKSLHYLNLENNNFHGVMPFNASFIKKLQVFKIGGNDNLCYNHSIISSKVKLGIAPCDKHGMPISTPAAKVSDGGGSSHGGASGDDGGSGNDQAEDDSSGDDGDGQKQEQRTHGPSKVVLGVAIGLSSLVFLIVFLVLLSKWCG